MKKTTKKKIKKWMTFMGTKNMIAIGALLILIVVIIVGVLISKSKDDENDKEDDTKIEQNSGLQVEENDEGQEGDSVDFGDLFGDEEDKSSNNKEEDNKNQGAGNGQDSNSSQGGNDTQDSNNTQGGLNSSDEEGGKQWGPLF